MYSRSTTAADYNDAWNSAFSLARFVPPIVRILSHRHAVCG